MHEFHAEKFVVPDGREPSLGALASKKKAKQAAADKAKKTK